MTYIYIGRSSYQLDGNGGPCTIWQRPGSGEGFLNGLERLRHRAVAAIGAFRPVDVQHRTRRSLHRRHPNWRWGHRWRRDIAEVLPSQAIHQKRPKIHKQRICLSTYLQPQRSVDQGWRIRTQRPSELNGQPPHGAVRHWIEPFRSIPAVASQESTQKRPINHRQRRIACELTCCWASVPGEGW